MKSTRLKFLRLIIISFSVLLFTSIIIESTANAAIWAGDRKNRAKPYAYYHSSVDLYGYKLNYDRGRAYWNANSRVNITKTTSIANRPDIYYIGNSAVSGLLGQIIPLNSLGNTVSVTSNWDYVTVFMYSNQMIAHPNYSVSRVNYNAAHEIGHAIKMAHVPIQNNSVMVQGFYPIPSSLTSFDSGEVNRKWP